MDLGLGPYRQTYEIYKKGLVSKCLGKKREGRVRRQSTYEVGESIGSPDKAFRGSLLKEFRVFKQQGPLDPLTGGLGRAARSLSRRSPEQEGRGQTLHDLLYGGWLDCPTCGWTPLQATEVPFLGGQHQPLFLARSLLC